METGGRFTPCSMFVLAQDLSRIEQEPLYAEENVYKAVWEQMRQPLCVQEGNKT